MKDTIKSMHEFADSNLVTRNWNANEVAQQVPMVMPEAVADLYLNALLRYTGGFYSTAIEHGMKAGETADAVAHVEKAARYLHKLAIDAAARIAELEEQREDLARERNFLLNNAHSMQEQLAAKQAALEYISGRLQMDIDDGSRPDQWTMEDLVHKARSTLATPPETGG